MSHVDVLPKLLDELAADLPAEPAWKDVLARARALGPLETNASARLRPRRRYIVAAFALVALVFAVVAAAYALGHPIVDFDKSPKTSSRTVVDFFGRMTLFPQAGGVPVLPRDARRIAQVEVAGRPHVLWVAPVRHGGYCYAWSGGFATCRTPATVGNGPPLDWAGLAPDGSLPKAVDLLVGSFEDASATEVQLTFADGRTASIPFIWVTKPIDGGFFIYGIPASQQRPGHRAVRIALLDAAHRVIAAQRMSAFLPARRIRRPLRRVRRQVAGYPPLMVPSPAVWSGRRRLFAERADNGTRVGLWVAPARGGGTCYWSNQGSGCPSRDATPQWPKIRKGRGYVSLCCTIRPSAARVVATFQDGDRVTLRPRDGFLIWPLPSRHDAPGRRLTRLVAYDASGKRLGALAIDPGIRGLYPCATPRDYGYGLKLCP